MVSPNSSFLTPDLKTVGMRNLLSLLLAAICLQQTTTSQVAQTAALIVGGFWEYENDPILPRVELFGCPGAEVDSFVLADFPDDNYLTNGVVVDDEKVLLCGGYTCTDTSCSTRKVC